VLLGSVDRLSGSLTAVSRFKNDALLFLHEQEDTALREAAELATEVERLQLDIKKKDAAIKAGKREQSKAARALANQEELVTAEIEKKDKEAAATAREAKAKLKKAVTAHARQEGRLKLELEKKEEEVTRLNEERTLLQKRLDRSLEQSQKQTDTLAEAKVEISDLEGRINLAGNQVEAGRLETERLKDRLQQARFEHKKLMQELDKKEREVGKAQKTRDNTKAKLEAAAKKLEERLSKAEFIERNLVEEAAKKDIEVKEAQVERDTMKAGLEASISSLEERLAKAEFEYRTLVEETSKKDGEIQETMAERDNIKARLDGDVDSLTARLTRLDYEHRTLLEQFAKKEGEFEQVERAYKRLITENEQLGVKVGSLDGRLEEAKFQVQVLQAEVDKKNDEIADAQGRRDALAEALQEERAQHSRGGVLLRRRLKSEFLGRSGGE